MDEEADMKQNLLAALSIYGVAAASLVIGVVLWRFSALAGMVVCGVVVLSAAAALRFGFNR